MGERLEGGKRLKILRPDRGGWSLPSPGERAWSLFSPGTDCLGFQGTQQPLRFGQMFILAIVSQEVLGLMG